MLNIKKTAKKLEQLEYVVLNRIYDYIGLELIYYMHNQEKSIAKFKTAEGLKIQIKFERIEKGYGKLRFKRYEYVDIEGQIDNEPFDLHFCNYSDDKSTDTIFSGKYGIDFWNKKDDKKKTIIKPFIKIGDKKVYLFTNKVINKILPLVEKALKDIKTIAMDEETAAYLKALIKLEEKRQEELALELEVDQLLRGFLKNDNEDPNIDSPHVLGLVLRK